MDVFLLVDIHWRTKDGPLNRDSGEKKFDFIFYLNKTHPSWFLL